MFNPKTTVLALGLLFLHSVTAAPAAEPQDLSIVKPIATLGPIKPLPTPTVTVTTTKCPGVNCRKVCHTPTVTAEPTGYCGFPLENCPVAMCLFVPAITSTSTRYCRDGGCSTLPTTACEKLPAVTVVPPCPTACPELCPIPITTVAVACTTSTTPVVYEPVPTYIVSPIYPTLIVKPTLDPVAA